MHVWSKMLSQPGVFSPKEFAPIISQCQRCLVRATHLHRVLLPEQLWLCGGCVWSQAIGKIDLVGAVDIQVDELPETVTDVPGLSHLPEAARGRIRELLTRHDIRAAPQMRRVPWIARPMSMRRFDYRPVGVAVIQLHRYTL